MGDYDPGFSTNTRKIAKRLANYPAVPAVTSLGVREMRRKLQGLRTDLLSKVGPLSSHLRRTEVSQRMGSSGQGLLLEREMSRESTRSGCEGQRMVRTNDAYSSVVGGPKKERKKEKKINLSSHPGQAPVRGLLGQDASWRRLSVVTGTRHTGTGPSNQLVSTKLYPTLCSTGTYGCLPPQFQLACYIRRLHVRPGCQQLTEIETKRARESPKLVEENLFRIIN